MSAADDKMRDAIAKLMIRMIGMLETSRPVDVATTDPEAEWVRVADVNDMLTNIAAHIAMMNRQAMQETADGAAAIAQDATHDACAKAADDAAAALGETAAAAVPLRVLAAHIRKRKEKAIELRTKPA